MKLVNKYIDKHGEGHVTLRPEDDEDMWHLYNLIQKGDLVRAPAIRRVQKVSNTGSIDSQRIRLNLTLEVHTVTFSAASTAAADGAASGGPGSSTSSNDNTTASLSISGRVTSENPHVRMGAFHTLDIEANRDVRIEKFLAHTPYTWDSVSLSRLEECTIPGKGAEVGAIVCGEGTAAFVLLSQHMTTVVSRINSPIPRKSSYGGGSQHEKALERFYVAVYEGFARHIPWNSPQLKVIVIASPGWVRDSVYTSLIGEGTKRGEKIMVRALKEKAVKIHVTSPHVHSLVEVLKSPQITAQLKETKFAKEGLTLDRFHKMLGSDELRAWYGPDHVALAADRGAIGTLLISDDLFRASDPETRKKYVALVEAVQTRGGEAVVFSSMHESGQQLNQLTGIAAILTFPLDVEVVEAEEKEAAEDLKRQNGGSSSNVQELEAEEESS